MPEAESESKSGSSSATTTREANVPRVPEVVERLIRRHGSAEAALFALGDDNVRYRRRVNTMKAEMEALTKKLPKEGSVVLSGDDLTAYNAFKELKLTPKQIGEAIKERDDLKTKGEREAGKTTIARAAKATGYNADVLADLAESKGLIIEVETVGKKDIAKVRKSKDAAPEGLLEYAKQHLKPYLPALKSTDDDSEERDTGRGDDAGASDDDAGDDDEGGSDNVINYPTQSRSGGKANAKDPVGAHLSQYKSPAQLRASANAK